MQTLAKDVIYGIGIVVGCVFLLAALVTEISVFFVLVAAAVNAFRIEHSRNERDESARQEYATLCQESSLAYVLIWAPTLKGDDNPTMSLAVQCWVESAPNKELYKDLFEASLDSLIQANPKQALRDLEEVSTPESPGLYPELRWYPPHQWTYHMMNSFEMGQLLIRIDWKKTNSVQKLPAEELPSFMDILQMM